MGDIIFLKDLGWAASPNMYINPSFYRWQNLGSESQSNSLSKNMLLSAALISSRIKAVLSVFFP